MGSLPLWSTHTCTRARARCIAPGPSARDAHSASGLRCVTPLCATVPRSEHDRSAEPLVRVHQRRPGSPHAGPRRGTRADGARCRSRAHTAPPLRGSPGLRLARAPDLDAARDRGDPAGRRLARLPGSGPRTRPGHRAPRPGDAGRLRGLRLPSRPERPAPHRDQHERRRRDAQRDAGEGAARLLQGARGPRERSLGPLGVRRDGAGDLRRRARAREAGRDARARRDRRRRARGAVPLSGVPTRRERPRGRGIRARIVDPSRLRFDGRTLRIDDDERPIDLVYNRLTDFSLAEPRHGSSGRPTSRTRPS